MKQFLLEGAPDRYGRVVVGGASFRYLVRVRRLAPGDRFPALLPDGTPVGVRVRSVEGGVLVGEVEPAAGGGGFTGAAVPSALPPVVLFQAIPKGAKMDLIVRQAAEGGITEVVPFESEFCAAGTAAGRLDRWQRIVREARQQSGSAVATAVRAPVTFDRLFERWQEIRSGAPTAVGLLFHHLPVCGGSLHRYLGEDPGAVAVAVGPEGGFSEAEVERFVAAGFRPFTVGNTVLRTETAALYAQAAVRILLLERDWWKTR